MSRIDAPSQNLETRIQAFRQEAAAIEPRAQLNPAAPATGWRACLPDKWLAGDEGLRQPLLHQSGKFTDAATGDTSSWSRSAQTIKRNQALEMDLRNRMLDAARSYATRLEQAISEHAAAQKGALPAGGSSSSSSRLEVVNDTVVRMRGEVPASGAAPADDRESAARLIQLLDDFHSDYEALLDQQRGVEARNTQVTKSSLRIHTEAAGRAVQPYAPFVACALLLALSYMIGQQFDQWEFEQRKASHLPEATVQMTPEELQDYRSFIGDKMRASWKAIEADIDAGRTTNPERVRIHEELAKEGEFAMEQAWRLRDGQPRVDRSEQPQLGTQRTKDTMNTVAALLVVGAVARFFLR